MGHLFSTHLRFQSTFPRGERLCIFRSLRELHHFNPRSRVGNDDDRKHYCKKIISIHVPAWGTTFQPESGKYLPNISIHVPAWGTTTFCHGFYNQIFISIHVPAWGTTYDRLTYPVLVIDFNPRSRVGNDS